MNDGSSWVTQLLQDIAIATSTLVMKAADGVSPRGLHTSPDHTVHLLFHLRVSPLHSPKIQVAGIVSLHLHRRSSSAPNSNPVDRTPNLHDIHAWLWGLLAHMLSFHGPNASTKHDGLDPLTPLAVWELKAQGAGKASKHWFPKLVAVIRSPITGLNGNLQGSGKVSWILEAWILPGHTVTCQEEASG